MAKKILKRLPQMSNRIGKVNINAVALLIEVSKKRNWHEGRIERKIASQTKKNLILGKVSYQKASAILALLGYVKVQDESWEGPL